LSVHELPSWRELYIPCWLPFGASAGTAVALCFSPASRRRRLGRCVGCGYDLQGSPGDRCSECGHARE
jgi:hypothetical protein